MLNSIVNFLDKHMVPIASKMNRNKYLIAMRDGLIVTVPFTIFGSIFTLICNFPFLDSLIGVEAKATLAEYLGHASTIALNLTSLIIAFTIAYNLAKKNKIDKVYGGLIGLFSFLMLIPFTKDINDAAAIGTAALGAQGMFLAIICSLSSGALYNKIVKKGWIIKLPDEVPENISKSFSSLIPIIISLTVFLIVRILFMFTPYGDALTFIYTILQIPLVGLGGTLGSFIIAAFLIQLLWFFGLHGGLIVCAIYDPIMMTLSQQNFDLVAAGGEPINIISKQFYQLFFSSLGGSSSFLALAIALVFFTKRKDMKEIGKIGMVPALFNIAEPLIFGIPTVLNPWCFIPLVLGPVITIPIAYFAIALGIVPIPAYALPGTLPPIINGVIGTGSLMGGLLQLLLIAIMFFIWLPFVKLMEKEKNDERDLEL